MSFFSFIAVASVDYIYLRAGRVRLRGWGVKSNFIFLPWGAVGVGGSKQIRTKNRGGQGNFFFFYNLSPDYFFSTVRIRQEGGIVQAD